MNNKRNLIIIGGIGVILLIGLISSLFIQTPTNNSSTTEQDSSLNEVVYITSLKGHKDDLNDSQIDSIQSTLYGIVRASEADSKTYYEGVIREGSYKRTNSDSSLYSVSFITDIPDIKKSWRVQYNADSQGADGSTPVIVSCLDDKEMIYGEFDCKDFYDQ